MVVLPCLPDMFFCRASFPAGTLTCLLESHSSKCLLPQGELDRGSFEGINPGDCDRFSKIKNVTNKGSCRVIV